RVSDALARRIVVLAERYVTDRYLPDKAIDLLDESCACAALRNTDLAEYDRLNEELGKRREEEENMTAAGEDVDYEKLAELRYEIATLDDKAQQLGKQVLGAEVTE